MYSNRTWNLRFSPCIIIVNHYYFPTNALNYTKLKRLKSTLYKSFKDKKLKITPTSFGSYVIHHQGVLCLTEITRSGSQIFCRVLGQCLAA